MRDTFSLAPARIFIDSSAFIAVYHPRDLYHEAAIQFRDEVLFPRRVDLYSSYYTLIETLNHLHRLEATREMRQQTLWKAADELIEAVFFRFVGIDDTVNLRSAQIVRKFGSRFSYTDAASLALMERENIRKIFSFDSGFDWFPLRVGNAKAFLRVVPGTDAEI